MLGVCVPRDGQAPGIYIYIYIYKTEALSVPICAAMAARIAPRPIGQQLLLDGQAAFAQDCESALPAKDFEWGWERDVKTAREQLLAAEALQWPEAEGLRMGALAA